MTDNVDWELKDRRIAWMSITKSLAEVQAALISSGLKKFNNLEEAMDDLRKSRVIELNAFLEIDSIWTPPTKTKGGKYFCSECKKEIPDHVKDWSETNLGVALCYDCQKIAKEKQ